MRQTTLILAGLILAATQPAVAQDAVYVGKDVRVRVIKTNSQGWSAVAKYSGQLVAWDDAGLHLVDREGVRVIVPTDDLSRMEVLTRRDSKAGAGAGYGLLVGAVTGAVVGAATAPGEDDWFGYSAEDGAIAGAVVFGVTGLLVGMVVGATMSGDSWTEVDVNALGPQPSLWVDPGGGGVALSTRF